MDVQAELAKAIKARHKKVYGIETQPPLPEKTKQKEKMTTNVGRSSKNAAHKAAAAAIAAKMGKPSQDQAMISSTSSRSRNATVINQNQTGALSPEEEEIADQYRKMKKLRMPDGAVRHKMCADGISTHIINAVFSQDQAVLSSTTSRSRAATVMNQNQTGSLSPEEEKIADQYRKMKKIGMPDGAVEHKMIAEGVSAKIQKAVFAGDSASSSRRNSGNTTTTKNTGTVTSLSQKDETIAAPYRKMIKTKIPEGAVIHKMTIDGIEMHIQDSVLEGETPRNKIGTTTNTSNTRPLNPMTAAIASGGIGTLKKTSIETKEIVSGRPSNPLAAAITASGGIGALKKNSIQSKEIVPERPSNPLAAAIAASGGIGALKKTSIETKEIVLGRPSNPLAAAIAASGGQGALKKTSVNNNQQSPKPRSSGNSLVDELAAKGFRSSLKKSSPRTQQPPQADTSYSNLTNKIAAKGLNLRKTPSKKIQSSIKKSSSDEELPESIEQRKAVHDTAVNTTLDFSPKKDAPKPSTMNKNMSSEGNQRSTMVKELHEQSHSDSNSRITNESKISVRAKHPRSTKMNTSQSFKPLPIHPQAKTLSPVPKPDNVVKVYIPPKSEVYVPLKPKSAKIARQKSEVYIPPKPLPVIIAKASNQTKDETRIAPEMRMNNAKQPAVAINSSEDGGTQKKEPKKKVKNSNKKKKAVRDDGVEHHCQCVVM